MSFVARRALRERKLQLEGECTMIKSFNTTYNDDDRVPTYYGVMFEMFPRVDMEMLTMELDIRIPSEHDDPDLSIEVYTMKDSYEVLKAYDADSWTLVADTTGVLLPGEKGLIIPTKDFDPVKLTAGQKQSFYITMKRSYIDHNVMALQKTGEVQVKAGDFDLLVGVGFTEYKFPGDYDRTVDPQFSGVFHFRRFTDCVKAVETTVVEFSFLLKQEVTPLLVTSVNQYVDDTIKDFMKKNSALKSYQKYFGLQQHEETKTSANSFDGTCPDNWNTCPTYYVTTRVSFIHRDNLESGQLSYELYRLADSVNFDVQSKLRVSETDIIYMGLTSLSADLTLSLYGVPEGRMMNDAEKVYFARVLTKFVQEMTQGSFIAVYQVDIVGQSFLAPDGVRRFLLGGTGTLRMEAKILGAQSTFLTAGSYRNKLEQVFRDGRLQFLTKIATNKLYPSDLSLNGGTDYFDSVTDIGGKVFVNEVAQTTVEQTEAKGSNTQAFLAVGIAIAGLALVALFLFLRRHMKRGSENKRDKENMRMLRKEREKEDRQALREVIVQRKGSSETFPANDSPGPQEQPKIECERSIPVLSHEQLQLPTKNLDCIKENDKEEKINEELLKCDRSIEGEELTPLETDNNNSETRGDEQSTIAEKPGTKVVGLHVTGGTNTSERRDGITVTKLNSEADDADRCKSGKTSARAQSERSHDSQVGMADETTNNEALVKSKSCDENTTNKKPRPFGLYMAEDTEKTSRPRGSAMSAQPTSSSLVDPHSKHKRIHEAEDIGRSQQRKAPQRTPSAPITQVKDSIGKYSGMTDFRPAKSNTYTKSKSFDENATTKKPGPLGLYMAEHADKTIRPLGSAMSVQPTSSSSVDPHLKHKRIHEAEDIGRSQRRNAPQRTPSASIPQVKYSIGKYSGMTDRPAKSKTYTKSKSFDENTTTRKPGPLGLYMAEHADKTSRPRGSAMSVQPTSTTSIDPHLKRKQNHEAEDVDRSQRRRAPLRTPSAPAIRRNGIKSKSFDDLQAAWNKSAPLGKTLEKNRTRKSICRGSAMSVQPTSTSSIDQDLKYKRNHEAEDAGQSQRRKAPSRTPSAPIPRVGTSCPGNPNIINSNRKTLRRPASFDEKVRESNTHETVLDQPNGKRRSKSFDETESLGGRNCSSHGKLQPKRIYLNACTTQKARPKTDKKVPNRAPSAPIPRNGRADFSSGRADFSSHGSSRSTSLNRSIPTKAPSASITQNERKRTTTQG